MQWVRPTFDHCLALCRDPLHADGEVNPSHMWQAVLCSMHGAGATATLAHGDWPLFLAALRPVHPHVYELGAFASRKLLEHRVPTVTGTGFR